MISLAGVAALGRGYSYDEVSKVVDSLMKYSSAKT